VHPQRLSLREQLTLFDGAEVVAGEYSSALHNTLFCRPGTRVISLDFYSWYQSAIGRLRQQPHGFVAPDDGKFRHWRSVAEPQRIYRIDVNALQAMISGIASLSAS
jgi:O-antigen biosynthesis protein WbqL